MEEYRLKYMFTTADSILFLPNPLPSVLMHFSPYLPNTSWSLLFPSPTCPLKSPPITTFSLRGTLWTTSCNLLPNSSFSSNWHPTCGTHTHQCATFYINPSIPSFKIMVLCDTFTSTIFKNSSFKITPAPFVFIQKRSLKSLPIFLALLPFLPPTNIIYKQCRHNVAWNKIWKA